MKNHDAIEEYFMPFRSGLIALADPVQAEKMAKYMQGHFEFYGLPSPVRKALQKQFLLEAGFPKPEDDAAILTYLWQQPEREWQYFGLDMMLRMKKRWAAGFIDQLYWMITHKSWWDTVDHLASHGLGAQWSRFPEQQKQQLPQWVEDSNLWVRRATILFQLKYKKAIDLDLQADILRKNLGSSSFFINKAIGWSLREISKTNHEWVLQFIEQTPGLSPLSKREALKWWNKHN
ncbi:DNA alkylation repair protein [Persicobacter psychrovividus]|uniref:DNA alkylation repair protein n=1 Tax=Persicobacter psychrovividus TaxID=387638 RepID=A0ABM7VHB2_9BACT|nr:hypothetical protein PEPS_26310 [Persicobacter psychrovividus]